MKKTLKTTKRTETRIIITGFTNEELNELFSTEHKESVEMILSMIDKETSDLIRKSHIKNIIVNPGEIIFVITDVITCGGYGC